MTKTTLRNDRILNYLCFVVLIFGIYLRISNPAVVTRSPDEKIYTYQSKKIAETGIHGLNDLLNTYFNNSQLWSTPPPNKNWIHLYASARI
jgi:hypothetical protein